MKGQYHLPSPDPTMTPALIPAINAVLQFALSNLALEVSTSQFGVYTVRQKTALFYFCNNFVKSFFFSNNYWHTYTPINLKKVRSK